MSLFVCFKKLLAANLSNSPHLRLVRVPETSNRDRKLMRMYEAQFHLRQVVDDVNVIARGRTKWLSFETVYRRQFNLVTHGYGENVYWCLREVLRQMSLCMRKKAFDEAVRLIYDTSLHLSERWCTQHGLPDIAWSAAHAYDRPVARRWRRALFMVRWECRLNRWREVFTEQWLRPGGLGEQNLAVHFRECADSFG